MSKHKAREEETTVIRAKAEEQSGGPALANCSPSFPAQKNWPPAAERSLPLETVPGKPEALTLRMFPTRGMSLLSLITWVHPDPPHPKLLYQGPQIKCLQELGR